jgi:hypothetical protein
MPITEEDFITVRWQEFGDIVLVLILNSRKQSRCPFFVLFEHLSALLFLTQHTAGWYKPRRAEACKHGERLHVAGIFVLGHVLVIAPEPRNITMVFHRKVDRFVDPVRAYWVWGCHDCVPSQGRQIRRPSSGILGLRLSRLCPIAR